MSANAMKIFQEAVKKDIDFYDSFLSVNVSTIESVKRQILNSDILKNNSHFNYFLKLLSNAPILRPESTRFFDSILKELIPFIQKSFSPFEISEMFHTKSQCLTLIEEKVIKLNQLYSKFSNDLSFLMFFYGDLTQHFSSLCQSKKNENKIVEDFVNNTDWNEFRRERKKLINQNEIAYSIREDNIELFIEKVYRFQHKIDENVAINLHSINSDELNFNIQIEHSPVETTGPINNLEKMPTLIEYSAFYGSTKIFKFLTSKMKENEIKQNSPELAYFASIGGDIEIAKYLLNLNYEFNEKCLNGAIEFHRYEVSNLIGPHPSFLTLVWSLNHQNFSYFNDHLDVLFDTEKYDNQSFLRLFDFACKNLPIFFVNFLFRVPKSADSFLFARVAKSCNLEIIKSAVENLPAQNLEINKTDKNGFNALHYACLNNKSEVAKFLLSQSEIDPNFPTNAINIKVKYYEMTPLHLVAENKNVEICSLLLNHPKIDVNKTIKRKSISPLMTACQNNSTEIIEMLLSHKADVNIVDIEKRNALHFAVIAHSIESVKILVSHKIDLNAKMVKKSVSPFLLAVENNEIDIVKYFLSLSWNYGLDLSLKDVYGIFKKKIFF